MGLDNQIVEFDAGGLGTGTFLVRTLEGFEELSGLFRFRLEFWSDNLKLKIEDLLAKPARIGLHRTVETSEGTKGDVLYNIFGMPASCQQYQKSGGFCRYTVEVVPRLWRLSRTVQSRIWQEKAVPKLVEDLLAESGSYAMEAGKDFEFKTTAAYPTREYTVQYQESDFAFVNRLLEHEGIFYQFTMLDDREKALFADGKDVFESVPGNATLKYQPRGAKVAMESGAARDEEVVHGFLGRQVEGPKKVQLADWNHRTPDASLVAEADCDPAGDGKVFEYGNHYKTKKEGEDLAKVRAQAILCRLRTFDGESNCRRLRPGAKFKLDGHYREDFNGEYLVTSVRHRIVQPVKELKGDDVTTSYENSFTCIPADKTFRPERRTPQPRIPGVMSALVHAPDNAEHPEIDDDGKYRLKFPFDILEKKDKGEKPSRPVRAAQPGTGADYGFTAPLKGNAEAVVGFTEGNPDRPVILASLPNPKNGTPVKGGNKSQMMWKSAANNMIVFEDKKDSEKIYIYAQKDFHLRVKNDDVVFVGNDHHVHVKGNWAEKVEGNRHGELVGSHVEKIDGSREVAIKGDDVLHVKGSFSLKVDGSVAQAFTGGHSVDCKGSIYLKATGLVLEATSGITLKCGGSSIAMNPGGVTIKGSVVALDGSSVMLAMPGPAAPTAGQAGSVAAPAAPGVPLDADEPGAVGAAGGAIGVLGGGGTIPKPHKPDPAKTHWVAVELVDQDNNPVGGARCNVKLPDGRVANLTLNSEGKGKVVGIDPGSCEVSFPDFDKGDVEA